MDEKLIEHPIHIDISMYNSDGNFTPSAYQRMIMSVIEEHLDALQIGEKFLMEHHGISWVLLSTSIELKRKLLPTDRLIGRTWHAGGRAPSFRRDFVFEDVNGEVAAVGATISTLFETETRKLCLNKEKLSVIDTYSVYCAYAMAYNSRGNYKKADEYFRKAYEYFDAEADVVETYKENLKKL